MKDAIVHNYIQNTVNITARTVNVINQKDFVIEGGVLKKYQGESVDVVIPNNVVSIRNDVFSSLKIKSVVIPNSVTEIGNRAFWNCTLLTSVSIPGSVKTIGNYAFEGCTSLTSVTIFEGVKTIGEYAFQNCAALTSVIIPDSLTDIGECAFGGCTRLKSVQLSKNLLKIGPRCFSGTAITKITIPESVQFIGQLAFGVPNLRKVSFLRTTGTIFLACDAFAGCTTLEEVDARDGVLQFAANLLPGETRPHGDYDDDRWPFYRCSPSLKLPLTDYQVKLKTEGRCIHCGG